MLARTSLATLVVLFALALPATASASSVSVGGSSVLNLSAGVTSFGQSFTVPSGTEGFLHTLRLNFRPASGTFHVSVSAVDGSGLPTGTPLYTSAEIASPAAVTVPTTVYPNVALTVGTQYAFFVDNAASGQMVGNLTNVYNGGREVAVVGGAWALGPTSDLNFRADFSTGQRASTTSLACTDTSVQVDTTTTCMATVVDNAGGTAPTGTVSFTDVSSATFTPSSCTPVDGTCTTTFQPGVVGDHAVSASYAGTSHLVSSGGATVTATTHPTSTAVDCTPAARPIAAPSACTVTVTNTGSGGTPTGTVSFASSSSGAFTPATCTLNDGACSVSYLPTAVGATGIHTITATYGGATTFSTSSGTDTVEVSTRTTETTTTCAPAALPLGEATTCTAQVTDIAVGTAAVPRGTVNFSHTGVGDLSAASCTLIAGRCSVTYTGTAPDTHTVTGSYAGSASFAPSTDSDDVTVRLRTTATSVACTPAAVPVGVATTCTATVADTDTGTTSTPGGTVSFSHTGAGDLSAASCTLSAGTCNVTYTGTATGTHTVTADYAGTATFASSADDDDVTVGLRTATTSVVCSPDTVTAGVATTCTATVADTDTGTTSTPGGTVAFTHTGDGELSASSCSLSGGTCSVSYTPSAAGTGDHTVTAGYDGDALYAADGASASIAVAAPTPDPAPQPDPTPDPPKPTPPLPPGPVPATPKITRLTSDVACLGTGARARRDITVRYTTSAAATTTFTLQRRTSPSVAAPTRCPAKLPAGNGATTKDGDPLVYTTASARRATSRATTAAVHRLVLTRTEAAGAHRLKLPRAFDVKTLRPGRYRLRIAPVAANGAAGPVATLYFWVLASAKAKPTPR